MVLLTLFMSITKSVETIVVVSHVPQRREPCKYHRLGQLLASKILLSIDHEHGTDYLQHFVQQNLRYARSSVS